MKIVTFTATSLAVAGLLFAASTLAQQPAGPGAAPGNPPASDGPGYGPGRGWGPGMMGAGEGYGWGPGMMMGPGMMGWRGTPPMCDPRAAGLAEWRMQRIERVVSPNEAQKKALEDLRAASTKAAETIAAACPKEFPVSAPARLEFMEKRMDSMLTAIKTVRPAFDAFYATLNDEQKARLNAGGPRGWGWHGWRGWRG